MRLSHGQTFKSLNKESDKIMKTQTIRLIQEYIEEHVETKLPSPSEFLGEHNTTIESIADGYACDVSAPCDDDEDGDDDEFYEAHDQACWMLDQYVAAGAGKTGLRFDEWWYQKNGWEMQLA